MDSKDLTEPAHEARLAAAGLAHQQEGPQVNRAQTDEIGKDEVDDVFCVGELEQQLVADLVERRHRAQRQRLVDHRLEGAWSVRAACCSSVPPVNTP